MVACEGNSNPPASRRGESSNIDRVSKLYAAKKSRAEEIKTLKAQIAALEIGGNDAT
jgi:hypothetical protein